MKLHLYLFVLIAVAFAACGKVDVPPVQVATHEVRDDLGRTVKVPEKIDRAISLAPNLTEMIFAVGAGDKLVGVTTYCDYPAEATKIEKVGDTQTPNIEKIIALKPHIVFVSTASQLEAFTRTLDERGIAVFVSNPTTLDGMIDNLELLGDLFQTKEVTATLVDSLSRRIRAVDESVANRNSVRVFVQISRSPFYTIGRTSFLTDIVERAGGTSVTRDVEKAFPEFSLETAAASDPDVILLSDSEDNREPNSAFKDSKAVKGGRVYRIDPDIISRPGPRLVDALEEIAAKLGEKK